jgi:DNA polymerase III alpha subunit
MDIDIDMPTKFDPTKIFKHAIPASMVKDNELVKHPCGHYFQTVPIDPHTNLAAIPYEEAEALGYFKVDFLHLSVLDHFASKEEIRTLLQLEPNWDILLDENHVQKLFQIHRHARLLKQVRPRSIQDLADCIALIRPGKRHLINQYLNDRDKIRETVLYSKDDEGYTFKRSHAVAYAMTIVLQLHLISIDVL